MIRVEGYVHSQTDGSPVYYAEVGLVRIDYVRGTVRELGTTVRTDTAGYYSLEAEYPYDCQTASAGKPFPMLTAHKSNAYGAGDHVPDCRTERQRLDFELGARFDTRIDTLYFSQDTLRLAVGESAVLSLIVLDTNADTVSSYGHPHFGGNEGLQWRFNSDVAAISHLPSFAVDVTGQAVGGAWLGVYFEQERRPWEAERRDPLYTRAAIVVE